MSAAHQTVPVNLAACGYDILIGRALLPVAAERIAAHHRVAHAVLITDENVQPHCDVVARSLAGAGARVETLVVPAGEKSKSVQFAERL